METFQYFVHYSFEADTFISLIGFPRRNHGEAIIELNRPVRSTEDLLGCLKEAVSALAREGSRRIDYPLGSDIRLESCSPWGSSHSKAYDKYDYLKP